MFQERLLTPQRPRSTLGPPLSEAPSTPQAGVGLVAVLVWPQNGWSAGVGGRSFNPPLSTPPLTALHKQYNAHQRIQSVHLNTHCNIVVRCLIALGGIARFPEWLCCLVMG